MYVIFVNDPFFKLKFLKICLEDMGYVYLKLMMPKNAIKCLITRLEYEDKQIWKKVGNYDKRCKIYKNIAIAFYLIRDYK